MVKRNKITVSTDNSGWKAPKKRKPRKPMSDEQKAAASERLAKAREARAEKNPDYGKSGIHESLHVLPDDHFISPKSVKQWIKTQKDLMSAERVGVRQNIKGAIARFANHEGYIRNMQKYLRDGDWIDIFYGEHQEKKMGWRCVVMAYYDDGTPKRNVDTFYPDIGMMWTQEMQNEESGINNADVQKPKRKRRKRNKRSVEKKKKEST
jgi:hypothetical protein